MKTLFHYVLTNTDIFIEALCYMGYLCMAVKFCRKQLQSTAGNERLFIFFSFIGWLLMNMANQQYSIPYIFFMILNHLWFMGLVLLLFQENRGKKILAASMLMIAVTLAGNFCTSFFSCLMLFFHYTGNKPSEIVLSKQENMLIICISFVIVLSAVYWMANHLTSVFCDKPKRWYVLLAAPLLVIIAVIDVVNWGASNGIMVKSGKNMGLYYDQIFSHAEICVLTGLSMFAVGFYVLGMDRIYLEQEKSGQYHAQIAVYQLLEEQYKQSERLRHDMKNHIIALSGLFYGKEWKKLGVYLNNMADNVLEADGDITGNKAVDALLYQKRKWAEKENIEWNCDLQIPKGCCINTFELCVILGNLLDNALEACEKLPEDTNRFVHLQAKTVKKCFLLEVKNSMHKMKGPPPKHGIGLLNVSDAVHRYNGIMDMEAGNGVFTVSILVPLSAAE